MKSYLTSFVEANMSQEVKGMLDQIRKEIKEATSSADGDGRESPSLQVIFNLIVVFRSFPS